MCAGVIGARVSGGEVGIGPTAQGGDQFVAVMARGEGVIGSRHADLGEVRVAGDLLHFLAQHQLHVVEGRVIFGVHHQQGGATVEDAVEGGAQFRCIFRDLLAADEALQELPADDTQQLDGIALSAACAS